MDNKETLSLSSCTICPRKCNIDRTIKPGFCKCTSSIRVAKAYGHMWEEPCISGSNGSGTVFFSGCNLKCVFCQNHEISDENVGKEITIEKLSKVFLHLQEKRCHNINLVSPTHYIPQIIEALKLAKNNGLNVPIAYNSNGYENVESLKLLRGYIDIYMPDLKYFKDKYSLRYSKAPNYFTIATKAIAEMVSQTGDPVFSEDGLMKKGTIIRHLMLPGLLFDSKKIVEYIYNTYGDSVYLSLMNQYTPMYKVNDENYAEINKTLNPKHYDALIDYCLELGYKNAFIQDSGTACESFVPEFDYEGTE